MVLEDKLGSDKALEQFKKVVDKLVLGKFGLVRFEPFLAKPETKPFGFCQKFSNPNPNRYKPFESVWFGLNSV
jgi:hypothetical protein